MKDSFSAEAIASLFTLSDTAVIGAQNNRIAFMNPAAQRALGCNATGLTAARLFPAHILNSQAADFVSSASLSGRHAIVTASSLHGCRLYSLTFDRPVSLTVSSGVFAPYMAALGNLRLITDYFSRYAEDASDPKFSRYCAELLKCYYQIHRWSLNASSLLAMREDALPFQPEAVDLGALCETLLSGVRYFADAHGIDVQFDMQRGSMVFMLDPALIERMLLNVLSNSLTHCGRGDLIRLYLSVSGGSIVLSVNDSGAGIPPEKLATIFSEFRTKDASLTTPDGAGFGLSVALGIAEMHGGTIVVESAAGGTSIRIMLSTQIQGPDQFRSRPVAYGTQQLGGVLSGLADFLDVSDFLMQLGE